MKKHQSQRRIRGGGGDDDKKEEKKEEKPGVEAGEYKEAHGEEGKRFGQGSDPEVEGEIL